MPGWRNIQRKYFKHNKQDLSSYEFFFGKNYTVALSVQLWQCNSGQETVEIYLSFKTETELLRSVKPQETFYSCKALSWGVPAISSEEGFLFTCCLPSFLLASMFCFCFHQLLHMNFFLNFSINFFGFLLWFRRGKKT